MSKKIAFWVLRLFARYRLGRVPQLRIIGVTGSVGKTTAKDAVAHIFSRFYRVLKSEKSYNTEFGLPMTILQVESPGRSLFGWIKVFFISFVRAFFSPVSFDYLIVEMGVDKLGDMDLLLSIARPHIAIFTAVAPVHLAEGQFEDLEKIYNEKTKIMRFIPSDGIVFLNRDDALIALKKPHTNGKVVWYGIHEEAKLRAFDIQTFWEGISFQVQYGEVKGSFSVPILGKHHISALLPAIGCALLNGIYMSDIIDSLKNFSLPPGRMSLIPGIRDSFVLDSSYNASPEAVKMALVTLQDLANRKHRKIFVFGNMNELGHFSEKAHRELSHSIAESVDILVTVGDQASLTADEVLKSGFLSSEKVHSFPDVISARDFVKGILQSGDLVLVKGSQNRVRLENLVKYIMLEPEKAPELLVRQEGMWTRLEDNVAS